MLIVAHRTGILGLADRLLVMRDGRVQMYGPTAEVVKALSASQGGRPPAPTHQGHQTGHQTGHGPDTSPRGGTA